MTPFWVGIASLVMFLGVAIGAFAAHGLRDVLSDPMKAIFETGVRYQFIHGLALFIVVAWLSARSPSLLITAAGWCFVGGTLDFFRKPLHSELDRRQSLGRRHSRWGIGLSRGVAPTRIMGLSGLNSCPSSPYNYIHVFSSIFSPMIKERFRLCLKNVDATVLHPYLLKIYDPKGRMIVAEGRLLNVSTIGGMMESPKPFKAQERRSACTWCRQAKQPSNSSEKSSGPAKAIPFLPMECASAAETLRPQTSRTEARQLQSHKLI